MTPQCAWKDSCDSPAAWMVSEGLESSDRYAPCCDAHLAATVRAKAVEWLGVWVDVA